MRVISYSLVHWLRMSGYKKFTGMAKPIPIFVPVFVMIDSLIPINWPLILYKAPPLLPGLIQAFV